MRVTRQVVVERIPLVPAHFMMACPVAYVLHVNGSYLCIICVGRHESQTKCSTAKVTSAQTSRLVDTNHDSLPEVLVQIQQEESVILMICVCVLGYYLVNAQLSRHRGLDVPSSLGGKVHHHRAVLHALNHGRGDEDGGLPAWRRGAGGGKDGSKKQVRKLAVKQMHSRLAVQLSTHHQYRF